MDCMLSSRRTGCRGCRGCKLSWRRRGYTDCTRSSPHMGCTGCRPSWRHKDWPWRPIVGAEQSRPCWWRRRRPHMGCTDYTGCKDCRGSSPRRGCRGYTGWLSSPHTDCKGCKRLRMGSPSLLHMDCTGYRPPQPAIQSRHWTAPRRQQPRRPRPLAGPSWSIEELFFWIASFPSQTVVPLAIHPDGAPDPDMLLALFKMIHVDCSPWRVSP